MELATRFEQWYYVVSAGSYNRVHKSREDILKEIEEADPTAEVPLGAPPLPPAGLPGAPPPLPAGLGEPAGVETPSEAVEPTEPVGIESPVESRESAESTEPVEEEAPVDPAEPPA